MKYLERERYEEVVGNSEMQSLAGIWSQFRHDSPAFETQRDLFLWVLDRLLREGRIKLHKNGVFLEGSIEKQVQKFMEAFPLSEDDADRICTKPGYEAPYKHFGMNVWWFIDVCPAGVAWRHADGAYVIAD